MEAGRVIFGISSFRGLRMLPKILKSFYEKYPKVKVDVVEAHSMELEELLIAGPKVHLGSKDSIGNCSRRLFNE